MKLLHTSDWHLGQSLNQFERSYEHAQFLAWLLDTLESEQIDVLLIAGDVFDNANPSAAAQGQLYQFLTQARQRVPHLGIVMTAGNHDSPARMEVPAPFLAMLDAHAVGHTGRAGDGVDLAKLVIPLKDATGAIQAWCIAMPFLRPSDLPRIEAEDPYLAGIADLYAQAYAWADAQRSPGQAIIALGHCHITGGQVSSESERRIVIGGSESLHVSIFNWRRKLEVTRPGVTVAVRCPFRFLKLTIRTKCWWWRWRLGRCLKSGSCAYRAVWRCCASHGSRAHWLRSCRLCKPWMWGSWWADPI